MLQKSKVATQQIFRENTKQKTIADSGTLNRAAEVACGFDATACVPSRLYTKAEPIARRNFDHRCKRTFATVSGYHQTRAGYIDSGANDPQQTPDLQCNQVAGCRLTSRREVDYPAVGPEDVRLRLAERTIDLGCAVWR